MKPLGTYNTIGISEHATVRDVLKMIALKNKFGPFHNHFALLHWKCADGEVEGLNNSFVSNFNTVFADITSHWTFIIAWRCPLLSNRAIFERRRQTSAHVGAVEVERRERGDASFLHVLCRADGRGSTATAAIQTWRRKPHDSVVVVAAAAAVD
jgi:hypothetical protein